MQHQRRLDVARMDADLVFQRRVHPRRHAEAPPGAVHHQHLAGDAQLARHHLEQRGIAAMRVDHHQLADAGAVHRLAELRPGGQRRLRGQRQRAGGAQVLVGLAHRLHRQHQRVDIVADQRHGRRHHVGRDGRVGRHRQMRPVLLDRGNRQHRDGARRVEAGKVGGGEVAPVARGHWQVSGGCQNRSIALRTRARKRARSASEAMFMW